MVNRFDPLDSQGEPAEESSEITGLVRRAFDALPAITAMIGPDGTIKLINGSWERFARRNGLEDPAKVSPGVNYLEVCRSAAQGGDESARKALEGIEEVLRGELQEFLLDYPCHSPDEKRWYLMKATPVREGGYVLITHIDISKLRLSEDALHESVERYRALYEDNPSIYFTIDSRGVVLSVNSFGAEQLGYTAEELTGQPVLSVIHPDDRESFSKQFELSLKNPKQVIRWEFRKVRKDGRVLWVREAARTILTKDGKEMILVVCEDITDRKLLEQELRVKNERLEQSHQELEEFVFVAAHDLQEPLRKIQTFSSMFLSKEYDPLEEENLDCLERMQKAAGRMQHLVNALKDYAKIAVNPVPLGEVSLHEIVSDAAKDLKEKIKDSDACLEIGELHVLEVDRGQMKHLFFHLIANAIDHRSEKKPVIKIHGEIKDDQCLILVEDNGIGFEEKYIDRIFKPFQRIRTGGEGTGMGLAICRKIVEHHRGTITAKSKPGGGSTFIIKLPVSQCKGAESPTEECLAT